MIRSYIVVKKDPKNYKRGTLIKLFDFEEEAERWVEKQENPDEYCVASADINKWKGWIGTP